MGRLQHVIESTGISDPLFCDPLWLSCPDVIGCVSELDALDLDLHLSPSLAHADPVNATE